MGHLVLLGDSTLDNAAYVRGGPAVIDQVRRLLPEAWRATLLAVDGSRIEGVHRQLGRLPGDASHLVLSVGGNDLLAASGVLGKATGNVGQGITMLADIRDHLEEEYAALLRGVVATGLPTVACIVYEPRFPDADLRRAASAALCLFADAMIRAARFSVLPVLDLRSVCSEDSDFTNPIEPSVSGREKIATALHDLALHHNFTGSHTVVYP